MADTFATYLHFVAIIFVQFAWFGLVGYVSGTASAMPRNFIAGAAAGIPLGVIFDLPIGQLGNIFHYVGVEYNGTFLLLNAVFSYGVAIATALSLSPGRDEMSAGKVSSRMALLAGALLLATFLLLLVQVWSSLTSMFIIGGTVLVLTELAYLLAGRKFYISQFIRGNPRPVLRVYVFSVSTGIVYEGANLLFPLWTWVNGQGGQALNLLLIVGLGYFVLFYPMFAFAGLINHQRGSISRAEARN